MLTTLAPRPLVARAAIELRPVALAALPVGAVAASVLAVHSWPDAVVGAVFVVALVGAPLAWIDARTHRLPDALTLPAIALTVVLVVVPSVVTGEQAAAGRALLGAAAAAGAHLVLWFAGAGIGLGDVKLVALLALPLAWYGWGTLLSGLFCGYLLGGFGAALLLVTRRAGLRSAIPFGPFLIAGALVALALMSH